MTWLPANHTRIMLKGDPEPWDGAVRAASPPGETWWYLYRLPPMGSRLENGGMYRAAVDADVTFEADPE